jgi:hypothetical protein
MTAIALLTHMGLGCCWHHSHAAAHDTKVAAVTHTGCNHVHPTSATPNSTSDRPHHSEDERCDEQRCVVIPTTFSLAPLPWDLLPGWFLPQPSSQISQSAWKPYAAADPPLQPPLTLVELHQILLV